MRILGIWLFFLSALFVFQSESLLADNSIPASKQKKIEWIQNALNEDAHSSKRWQYFWTGFYGLSTCVESADAISKDGNNEEDDRFDATVNATTSFLGFCSMVADPVTIHNYAKELSKLPETTSDEINEKLLKAESFLRAAAKREKRGRSLTTHLISFGVNLAAGLIVLTDGGRESDGLIMFSTGLIVGEIQIATTPKRSIENWKNYRIGQVVYKKTNKNFTDNLHLGIAPGYISLTCSF